MTKQPKTDLYFTTNGYFFNLIPNNAAAEKVFNQVAAAFDGASVPVTAWASVKLQIKQAGYSIRKAPKINISKVNDDELLAELMA